METKRGDAGNPFLDIELNAEQVQFLRAVLYRVTAKTAAAENAPWPRWQTIRGPLFKRGHDAERAARSFPTVATSRRWPYGPIWGRGLGATDFLQTDTVGLTIAGVHLVDPARADRLVQLIARFGSMEVDRDYSGDDGEPEIVSFNDHAGDFLELDQGRSGDFGAMSMRAAAELLQHEYIPLVSPTLPGSYEVRLGSGELSRYAKLDNAHDYLRIIVDQAHEADARRPPRVHSTGTTNSVNIQTLNQYGGNAAYQSQIDTQRSE